MHLQIDVYVLIVSLSCEVKKVKCRGKEENLCYFIENEEIGGHLMWNIVVGIELSS